MPQSPRRHKLNEPLTSLFQLYRKRGEVYRLIGSYDNAFDCFKRMEIAARINGDEQHKAEAAEMIGSVFLFKGEFDKAEALYTDVLKMYADIGNLKGQADCYRNIGIICQNHENYFIADDYYCKAVMLYRNNDDKDGEYNVLKHIAGNYRKLGQYEKALQKCKEILVYLEENKNKVEAIRIYQLIGNLLIENNEIEEGLQYLKDSLVLAKSVGDNLATVYILCDLGIGFYTKEDYAKAREYFDKCLHLTERYDIQYMMSIACLNLGDVCIKLNDFENARLYLDKVSNTDVKVEGIKVEINRLINELNELERR